MLKFSFVGKKHNLFFVAGPLLNTNITTFLLVMKKVKNRCREVSVVFYCSFRSHLFRNSLHLRLKLRTLIDEIIPEIKRKQHVKQFRNNGVVTNVLKKIEN